MAEKVFKAVSPARQAEYKRTYDRLMERARGREYIQGEHERHHIIPRSLGGSNAKDNIVCLTYREHFLAHWLLTKFLGGNPRHKMLRALGAMSMIGSRSKNYQLTPRQYGVVRKACAEALTGGGNPMSRPEVQEKHKRALSDPEVRKSMGFPGDRNCMNRPEVKLKHLENIPRGPNNFMYGKTGEANSMADPIVREKQLKNVPRGDAHHMKGRTGPKNVMSIPSVKKKHKQIMVDLISGDKNPVHIPSVKEKIGATNSLPETKRKRSLSQATITEEQVRYIYNLNDTVNNIAKNMNLTYNLVYGIKTGRTWKYLHA
jgi:hypothetical protein